jgi:hypothetical protein
MNIIEITAMEHERANQRSAIDRDCSTSHCTADINSGRPRRAAVPVAAVVALMMMFLVDADARAATHEKAKRDDYVKDYVTIVRDQDFSDKIVVEWRKRYPKFDWSTDGCSGGVKHVSKQDFAQFFWPCAQHDFGYRNNDFVGRHDDKTRAFVDSEFLERMRAVCDKLSGVKKTTCRGKAKLFYAAVHKLGTKAWNKDTRDPWY